MIVRVKKKKISKSVRVTQFLVDKTPGPVEKRVFGDFPRASNVICYCSRGCCGRFIRVPIVPTFSGNGLYNVKYPFSLFFFPSTLVLDSVSAQIEF